MKHLLAVIALVLFAGCAAAQNPAQIVPTTTTPTGACNSTALRLKTPSGVIYSCANGMWAATGGGEGPQGPAGPVGSSASTGVISGGTAGAVTLTHNFGTIIHSVGPCIDQSSGHIVDGWFVTLPLGMTSDTLNFPVPLANNTICYATSGGGSGGGGGMIGDPTGGDPFDVLFPDASGNLSQDPNFGWHPQSEPAVTGQWGLSLGPLEPANLSDADGNASGFSMNNTGGTSLNFLEWSGQSGPGLTSLSAAYLSSRGTQDIPIASGSGDAIQDVSYYVWNGSPDWVETFYTEVDYEGTYGRFLIAGLETDSGTLEFALSPNGSLSTAVGFSPIGTAGTELEINQGVPVSSGGSLATITVATLEMASATTALPNIFPKTSASPTAPGAGGCTLRMEAGTNSGTGKLVAYCGTSATGVTIVDNIGAAF
jgi:hypothetical protein